MAITVPTKCYRQKDETVNVDSSGGKRLNYVLKGPYESLATLMDSLVTGEEIIKGWLADTWDLARHAGNIGVLTISCNVDAREEQDDGSMSTNSTIAEDETWSLRSVRNDVSILAYCGVSGGDENTMPRREIVESWQKEPDGELAARYVFMKTDGTEYQIEDGATKELIQKLEKGIDSVMRFYPMLTKTLTYLQMPKTVYENLACIDTPTLSAVSEAKKWHRPGNLEAIIAAHDWLKCQDDLTATPDGKFQRVQSWIGVLIINQGGTLIGWDKNLYGTGDERWSMPYLKK